MIYLKDLPSVSDFSSEKEFHNFQESYYTMNQDNEVRSVNVNKKINDIFASKSHVYKSKCRIYLKDGEYEKIIIGRTNTELITIIGEKIRIIDIKDIEKID